MIFNVFIWCFLVDYEYLDVLMLFDLVWEWFCRNDVYDVDFEVLVFGQGDFELLIE